MLTQSQLEQFHRDGFLVAKDIVPRAVIRDLQEEIDQTIDTQARALHGTEEITELHEALGFLHRATELCRQSPKILDPVTNGTHCGRAMFGLIACSAILDVMEQLLGGEIIASSIYRLRPKLPDRPEGVVPWHQDSGYFDTCADEHLVPTCWVPLMNATVDTGCMEVLPGCHRQGVFRHYWAEIKAPSLSIHPDHMPDVDPIAVPADVGDVVLMTNMTPHRSTDNRSGLIRWAADLRYNAPQAGDYGPGEASFLARSRARPGDVVTDWREFVRLRENHVPAGDIDRKWLKQDDETFLA